MQRPGRGRAPLLRRTDPDGLNRTPHALTPAHAFKAAEQRLKAQAAAKVMAK